MQFEFFLARYLITHRKVSQTFQIQSSLSLFSLGPKCKTGWRLFGIALISAPPEEWHSKQGMELKRHKYWQKRKKKVLLVKCCFDMKLWVETACEGWMIVPWTSAAAKWLSTWGCFFCLNRKYYRNCAIRFILWVPCGFSYQLPLDSKLKSH